MKPAPAPVRHFSTVARWPVGMGLASWRYVWRTTPVYRRDEDGTAPDAPPELAEEVRHDGIQRPEDGVGPLFHRTYRTWICQARLSPEELIERITSRPNRVSPVEVAVFRKRRGEPGRMCVGDEYLIRMPGPWDGPVRVVARTPTSFRFATLAGHLEAGQIEFSAARDGSHLAVTIESWAAGGDRLSYLLYDRIGAAKEMQLHMWMHFLRRAARVAGGRMTGGVEVRTRRVAEVGGDRVLASPQAHRALDELHDKKLNFDLDRRASFTPENGWHVDHYCTVLPAEKPGEPAPGGSWETARRLMRDYEFADPSIVRAIYYPEQPLERRDMLLEGHFYGLRFYFGVRVGGVIDETRNVDGRPVRVWGWNYRTLQGHLEMGQMDYEVWKWLDSGVVEFRIHAFSKAAHIPNPIVRLGFALFGRRMQVRFARHACARMARLTAAELARGAGQPTADPVPRVADRLTVQPAGGAERPRRKLSQHTEPADRDAGATGERLAFGFAAAYRFPALLFGITPRSAAVRVGADTFAVSFGPWHVRTTRDNIVRVEVTGPYGYLKTAGPAHLSLADRGLTLATNGDRGVCVAFHRPVRGIEPLGVLRHPAVTVTVADPDRLVRLLSPAS